MRTVFFDRNIPKVLAVKALKPLTADIVFSRLSPARLAEVPEPELPGPRWVRLRNKVCGICASDLTFLYADVQPQIGPAALPNQERRYLGHEVVSEVIAVGPDVTRFKVGDRAMMYTRFHGPNCLTQEIDPLCRLCAEGQYLLCENATLNLAPPGIGGGWGDGYTAHETEIYPVPDDLSDDQAAMVEPLAVGLHAVLRRPPQAGDRVLVLGCGIIGLNVIQALRALVPDCHISALARYEHQAAAARRLGADEVLDGQGGYEALALATGAKAYQGLLGSRMLLGGFDVIYDNVGSGKTIQDCLRWSRARGAVVVTGLKLAPLHLDLTPLWFQEVDLIGVNTLGRETWEGRQVDTFELAIELLRQEKLTIAGLITHRFGIEQWREAVHTARDKRSGAIKVVFDYSAVVD